MRKKIRILYVMDHFHSPAAGTEGQIFNLIKNLDRKVFEPEFFFFYHVSDYFNKEEFPCPVVCLNINSFLSLPTYEKLYRIRQHIISRRIDIVQCVFNDASLYVPFVTMGLPVKTITTRRDMGFWYNPLRLAVLRMNRSFTDWYLVNSNSIKQNIQRMECVPERKIKVIYNSHDFSKFIKEKDRDLLNGLSIPTHSKIIGIVSNLRPVKRVQDFIMAIPHVLREVPECYFVIAGHPGEVLHDYIGLTKELQIENRVRFLGMIDDPIPLIKSCSIGVNCSETEGLSNSIIEYMGCRVPVVATDTSGNHELIENGRTGILVPVADPRGLARGIVQLLRDNELCRSLVSNAHESVKERFDSEKIHAQYNRFYCDILNDGLS